MAKEKKVKLSKTSKNLLEDFDEWAKSQGWQQDMGVGKEVDRTKKNYEEAKAALEKRIAFLETKARRLYDLQETVRGMV